MGNIMTNMRQSVTIGRNQTGKRSRQRIATDRIEEKRAVIKRIAGAIVRTILVVLLVATPSIVLPETHSDTALLIALIAVVAAVFTFAEYNSEYPSLVEFRDAPPFNRIRFVALGITVFALSLICLGTENPTTLTQLLGSTGARLGELIDFPYSPVRLVLLVLPTDAPAESVTTLRTAAGVAYFFSIVSLAFFVLMVRFNGWPTKPGGFNVWTNLPTFDPTAGGDIVERLNRDGQINIILGFLLPFIIPALVKFASDTFSPISLESQHTMIWTVTAWAFLPSSLIMRGTAMGRIAQMVEEKRKRSHEAEEAENYLPA